MRQDFVIATGSLLAALLVVAALIAFFSGTPTPSAPPATVGESPISFTQLAMGSRSGIDRRTNYLITSEGQLRELWKLIDAGGAVPSVDFTQDDVIAVFSGTEPTVGHTIEVSRVEETRSRLVTVTITRPGPTCALAQMFTNPYQVVIVKKSSLPYTHKDVTVTRSCF